MHIIFAHLKGFPKYVFFGFGDESGEGSDLVSIRFKNSGCGFGYGYHNGDGSGLGNLCEESKKPNLIFEDK